MVPILIVDDAPEDLVFAQRVLGANRILNPILPLRGGKACLDYFTGKNAEYRSQFPCVVLLDIVMKPFNGLDVLRALQNIPDAKGSIVIMLSGLADIKMVSEGYRLGASTFLIKPLAASELKQMLESVSSLTLRQTDRGCVVGIRGHEPVEEPGSEEQRAKKVSNSVNRPLDAN
jgi:CheY-like chemotaxis protein